MRSAARPLAPTVAATREAADETPPVAANEARDQRARGSSCTRPTRRGG